MKLQNKQKETPLDISQDEHLPAGWKIEPLGEGLVLEVQPGFACGEHNREGFGIPQLRPMNVHESGSIDLSLVKYVPESKVARQELILRKGDVLFNNTNSPELVGKTAHYDLTERATFSNHMTRVRCNTSALDPKYCAMALHHKWREGYFRTLCNNHVSQSSVSRSVLLETPLPVPPVPEQKRIVAKIEELLPKVDAVRERLIRVKEIMRSFRQSVLSAAFSGRLTEDWRNGPKGVQGSQRYIDEISNLRRKTWGKAQPEGRKRNYPNPIAYDEESLPNIPASWQWAPADALCSQITDGEHIQPPYQSNGYPLLTAKHVRNGYVTFEDAGYISELAFKKCLARCAPQKGDILIVSVGATTGRSAIVENLNNFAIVRSVLLLKPLISPKYFFWWLQSPWCFNWMVRASGASAQPHLYIRDTKKMPVPVAPVEEQQEIVSRVESLCKLADKIEKRVEVELSRTDKMTQAVLAKAFRGELVTSKGSSFSPL